MLYVCTYSRDKIPGQAVCHQKAITINIQLKIWKNYSILKVGEKRKKSTFKQGVSAIAN